jgi:hypothetical protein
MTSCGTYWDDHSCIAFYACYRVEIWNCKALNIMQWKLHILLNFFVQYTCIDILFFVSTGCMSFFGSTLSHVTFTQTDVGLVPNLLHDSTLKWCISYIVCATPHGAPVTIKNSLWRITQLNICKIPHPYF